MFILVLTFIIFSKQGLLAKNFKDTKLKIRNALLNLKDIQNLEVRVAKTNFLPFDANQTVHQIYQNISNEKWHYLENRQFDSLEVVELLEKNEEYEKQHEQQEQVNSSVKLKSELQASRLSSYRRQCKIILDNYDDAERILKDKGKILDKMNSLTYRNVDIWRPILDRVHHTKFNSSHVNPKFRVPFTADFGNSANNFYSIKNFDLMMCIPPKTGTSFWQISMMALQQNRSISSVKNEFFDEHDFLKNNHLYGRLPRLKEHLSSIQSADPFRGQLSFMKYGEMIFSTSKKEEETKPIKIINARHPLARLYSCWKDKFTSKIISESNSIHAIKYAKGTRKVFSRYYHPCQSHETTCKNLFYKNQENEYCSFYAFLDWIANGEGYTTFYNKHWGSIYGMCRPCLVDYDFIANTETVNDDMSDFFGLLGEPVREILGDFPQAYHYNNDDSPKNQAKIRNRRNIEQSQSRKIIEIYIEHGIPKTLISKLYELYLFDFILFDYKIDDILEGYPENLENCNE